MIAAPPPRERAVLHLFDVSPQEEKIAAGLAAMRHEGPPRVNGPLLLLCFTNRSGSNLLREYLRSTGRVAGLAELLNPLAIVGQAPRIGVKTLPDYIAHHAGRAGPKAVWGMKAHAWQLAMLLRANIGAMFSGGLRLVHISREDRVAQAVSHLIAQQTRRWTSAQPDDPAETVAYDRAQISQYLIGAARANEQITLLASLAGLPRLPVSYEDLTTEPAAVVTRIGAFLGHDLSGWHPPTETDLARQADVRNEAFIARFRAEIAGAVGVAL